jgi:hypothetical protein
MVSIPIPRQPPREYFYSSSHLGTMRTSSWRAASPCSVQDGEAAGSISDPVPTTRLATHCDFVAFPVSASQQQGQIRGLGAAVAAGERWEWLPLFPLEGRSKRQHRNSAEPRVPARPRGHGSRLRDLPGVTTADGRCHPDSMYVRGAMGVGIYLDLDVLSMTAGARQFVLFQRQPMQLGSIPAGLDIHGIDTMDVCRRRGAVRLDDGRDVVVGLDAQASMAECFPSRRTLAAEYHGPSALV